MQRVVVLGTGTSVGKTYVSRALVQARAGSVTGLKPIETGVTDQVGEDAKLLDSSDRARLAPYRFVDPVTPSLAARRSGTLIDLRIVRQWVEGFDGDLVIESAGGCFSAIGAGVTNVDLARSVGATSLVMVVPDRLGALHDAASACLALAALGSDLPAPLVVFNRWADGGEEQGLGLENAAEFALALGGLVRSRGVLSITGNSDNNGLVATGESVWGALGGD